MGRAEALRLQGLLSPSSPSSGHQGPWGLGQNRGRWMGHRHLGEKVAGPVQGQNGEEGEPQTTYRKLGRQRWGKSPLRLIWWPLARASSGQARKWE
jgi:hypothetical protein